MGKASEDQLRLMGSSEAYRRKGEPSPVLGDPEPPGWLSDRAREQWDRMVSRLREMQVLSPAYREALAQYCEAWAEYETLVEECQDEPHTITSLRGGVYCNPIFGMKNQAFDRLLKLGKQFGYSPASKTGVRMEKKPQQTSKKRFFEGA